MSSDIISMLPWIIIAITFIFFLPAILHLLWNNTMPEIFDLKKITYWQAFRLVLMSFVLFGVWSIGG